MCQTVIPKDTIDQCSVTQPLECAGVSISTASNLPTPALTPNPIAVTDLFNFLLCNQNYTVVISDVLVSKTGEALKPVNSSGSSRSDDDEDEDDIDEDVEGSADHQSEY